MSYFILGLSFSAFVIAVNAAVTINSGTVGSGTMMTAGMWNTMVNDLNGIRNEVNGMAVGFTTCMTKTSTDGGSNTAGDGWLWSTVDCDPGWTMTGGGCLVNQYCWTQLLRMSYPTANGWYCGQTINGCDWSKRPHVYVRCCRQYY